MEGGADSTVSGFRDFLGQLAACGDLQRIRGEVDPRFELGAIIRKVSDEQGPALLFERVGDSGVPVVANLFGTRKRVAMALDADLDDLTREWVRRLDRSVPSEIGDRSPLDEGMSEAKPDLRALPIPTLNEKDGGPFITGGLVLSRDPDSGARNAAIYRLQVHGPSELGILASPHRDAGRAIANAAARGEDLPVAIAIGVAPELFIAGCSSLPFGVWEVDVAGALGRAPIRLMPVHDGALEAPEAEIILEGVVRTRERKLEGPFGEFTGYYGPAGQRPVVDVTRMYLRPEPMLHVAYVGYPITETQVLQTATGDPTAYQQLKPLIPGLVEVHLPASSAGQPIMYISLRKRSQGEAGNAILAAMATKAKPKYVVVVDDDVDVHDESMVMWAIATRSRPDRGVYIVPDSVGMTLDPTATHLATRFGNSVVTSKMGIDATIPLDREDFPEVIRPHPVYARRVAERWDQYLR